MIFVKKYAFGNFVCTTVNYCVQTLTAWSMMMARCSRNYLGHSRTCCWHVSALLSLSCTALSSIDHRTVSSKLKISTVKMMEMWAQFPIFLLPIFFLLDAGSANYFNSQSHCRFFVHLMIWTIFRFVLKRTFALNDFPGSGYHWHFPFYPFLKPIQLVRHVTWWSSMWSIYWLIFK